MGVSFGSRLQHAWNAFKNREGVYPNHDIGPGGSQRPDRVRLHVSNERSIITSVYSKLAIDIASIDIKHVRVDQNGSYKSTMDSELNERLGLSANIDQTGQAFIQDVMISMFDEGAVAIVPVETQTSPDVTETLKILSMRTGRIIEWFPQHVRIRLYNETTGFKEEITMPKNQVAIIENPLYAIMNEPNSTLQRLIRKLNLLDAIDEQSGSGKLDLLIQLPYVIKSEARRKQAEERRKEIEDQLAGSKYGIAYVDGTERVTQLNRPAENNLMTQITYLTSMLYSQLGLTETILDGTADEKTMLNYYNRTVEPCISAVVNEMKRKFLTKTARSQGQSIMYFRDVFKLVPVFELAEIVDKFTRNEVLTSNEFRSVLGYRPSDDPRADELRNKNLNATSEDTALKIEQKDDKDNKDSKGEVQNEI